MAGAEAPTTVNIANTLPTGNVAIAAANNNDNAALEVDADTDSAFEDDDNASETTSTSSSIIKGHMQNGRRYASLRGGYWGPSDERQFETMDQAHFVYLLMRSDQENPLFAAPVKDPKRILDVGTGSGTWAIDVADQFPNAIVHGVDLFPPPNNWVPQNCLLEVEDVAKEWTWMHKFDLIHFRVMVGSFTPEEWDDVYRKCYENLQPGGWIEQCEPDANVLSDDGTLDPEGHIAHWGEIFSGCANRLRRPIETVNTARAAIEKAGFTNIHEEYFKIPIGSWPKNEKLKEAGKMNRIMWSGGLEGFSMFLLTNYGAPKPWSKEEVQLFVSQVRGEFKRPGHIYHFARRVWAQKPLDS